MSGHRDRGSMGIVVVATALAWMLALALAVAPVVEYLAVRQRAQSAADAAALAAVTDGCEAAASLATVNGGTLLSCERVIVDGGVVVTVRSQVASAQASARATNRSDP